MCEKLSPFARRVLEEFPVRKGKAEKAAFRAQTLLALREMGWNAREETGGGLVKSHNLVAGSPTAARLVFTAHYDTPARLPIPNFIAPRNLPANLLYGLLVGGLVFLIMLGASFGLRMLGAPAPVRALAMLAVAAGIILMMLAGPDNPSNANDNTSGVVTLLEIAAALPAGLRGEVALVFFDNEELGLLGSAAFRKANGGLENALLLNFDCVGVGDTLLFALPKALRSDAAAQAALQAAFPGRAEDAQEGHAVLLDSSAFTLYPSDQMLFARGVGVVALKRAPVVGLHVSGIHTAADTRLEQDNILFLRDGALRLARAPALPAKAAGLPEQPARRENAD